MGPPGASAALRGTRCLYQAARSLNAKSYNGIRPCPCSAPAGSASSFLGKQFPPIKSSTPMFAAPLCIYQHHPHVSEPPPREAGSRQACTEPVCCSCNQGTTMPLLTPPDLSQCHGIALHPITEGTSIPLPSEDLGKGLHLKPPATF